jgi:hypothetical protein
MPLPEKVAMVVFQLNAKNSNHLVALMAAMVDAALDNRLCHHPCDGSGGARIPASALHRHVFN